MRREWIYDAHKFLLIPNYAPYLSLPAADEINNGADNTDICPFIINKAISFRVTALGLPVDE